MMSRWLTISIQVLQSIILVTCQISNGGLVQLGYQTMGKNTNSDYYVKSSGVVNEPSFRAVQDPPLKASGASLLDNYGEDYGIEFPEAQRRPSEFTFKIKAEAVDVPIARFADFVSPASVKIEGSAPKDNEPIARAFIDYYTPPPKGGKSNENTQKSRTLIDVLLQEGKTITQGESVSAHLIDTGKNIISSANLLIQETRANHSFPEPRSLNQQNGSTLHLSDSTQLQQQLPDSSHLQISQESSLLQQLPPDSSHLQQSLPDSSHIQPPPPPPDSSHIQPPPPPPDSSHIQPPPPPPDSSHIQPPPPPPDSSHIQPPPPPESSHMQQPPPPPESSHVQQPPPPESSHMQQPPPPPESSHMQQPPPPPESSHAQQPPPPESSHMQQPPPPESSHVQQPSQDEPSSRISFGEASLPEKIQVSNEEETGRGRNLQVSDFHRAIETTGYQPPSGPSEGERIPTIYSPYQIAAHNERRYQGWLPDASYIHCSRSQIFFLGCELEVFHIGDLPFFYFGLALMDSRLVEKVCPCPLPRLDPLCSRTVHKIARDMEHFCYGYSK